MGAGVEGGCSGMGRLVGLTEAPGGGSAAYARAWRVGRGACMRPESGWTMVRVVGPKAPTFA